MVSKLKFRMQTQQAENWCWAAVTVSVARYFDRNSPWRQCALVQAVQRCPRQAGNQPPAADRCAEPVPDECDRPFNISDPLNAVGRPPSQRRDGPLTFEEIQREINASRPVCAWIKWRGGGAHFVVISGCWVRQGEQWLEVKDPLTEGHESQPYDRVKNNYHGKGEWGWTCWFGR